MTFRPKYITFDCYGTLTYFPLHQVAYDLHGGQPPAAQMLMQGSGRSEVRREALR
jgi:2-haloacid dehalogenase